MKIIVAILSWCMCVSCLAQYEDFFEDKTLRLNYTFSGNNREQRIFLDEVMESDGWYGRRSNMDSLLLSGNGQMKVRDLATDEVIYVQSFSTLFQEWQTTEEATKISMSFENCFLIPKPKMSVQIELMLTDTHNQLSSRHTYTLNPQDILIRKHTGAQYPWKYLLQNGDSKEKIDVVFVPEGYTKDEMSVFYDDCKKSMDAILGHEPFLSMQQHFNFLAVESPSEESGVSIPHLAKWVNTVLQSNYDTFYSERYLTTKHLKGLHNILNGIPYEHIIILANTDNYGGGGIYNSYLMSAAHNSQTSPVMAHEFGHSFAGLADEYYYDDQYETMYPSDTEPWEPNITTLFDFDRKWKDMLTQEQLKSIPTKPDGKDIYNAVGVYEGGGYQSKGVYRPVQECRMKRNDAPIFCPVCQRAIKNIINYQVGK